MPHRRFRLAAAVALAVLASTGARAQDELFHVEGDDPGAELAGLWGITPLGDVDGDGRVDFAVAERKYDGAAGVDCGRVRVFSGATQAVLRTYEGESAGDWFGHSVNDVLDLDGDGVHDLGVSALHFPAGADNGKVYVYSGATGALIRSYVGENPHDLLSYHRGVGDATGDGVNDLLVVAFLYARDANGYGSGKAYLYSGADDSLYNSWIGQPGSDFGARLGRLGFDADGDGCNDFAIGTFEQGMTPQGVGHVYVYSAKSATPIATFAGNNVGDLQGYTADAADVDGDGTPDLLVGSPLVNANQGVTYLYSGKDWSLLRTWNGGALRVGADFALAGDVDGDGRSEIVFSDATFDGPAGTNSGAVALLSGRTGRELTRWYGETAGEQFAANAHVNAGDLDGDGFLDLFLGGGFFDGAAGSHVGKLQAFRGNDLYLNVEPAVAGAGDAVALTTTAGVPGNLLIDVVTEVDGQPTFQLLTPAVTFDANGEFALSGTVPPGLGAHTVKFVAYAIGASGKLVDSSIRQLTLQ